LVGTTDSNLTDNTTGSGIVAQANGALVVAREANTPFYVNRTGTSDGTLVDFRKDGGTVGSIGTQNGSDFYITGTASDDTGLRFQTNEIVPVNDAGGNRDNAIDLGKSNIRFKDLYLSGGAYLGGTAAANYLDSYEEGTWTVTLTPSVSGTISYAAGGGASYTKIGQVVHISISVTNNSSSSPNGYISFNLPFAAASGGQKGRSALALYLDGVSSNNVADFIGLTIDGASEGRIYLGDDGAAQTDSAQQMDGSCYILISGTYITSA